MDATQQAHDFLKNARYADFFKLMQLNKIEMPEIALLRMEFEQGKWDALFPERVQALFNSLRVEVITPLPPEQMTAIARILSKFYFPTGVFIGRKQELQDLHASLQKNLPTVLVNGLGGIGKTTLAKEYIRRHLDKYAHIVWVEQTASIIDAFVNDVVLLKNLNLTFQQEINEQRFELICNALQQTKGTNLLVLDNYQRPTDEETFDAIHQLAFPAHWRVLITSREKILDFETLELDILSEAEAMELFRLHAGKKVIDENELRDLLETVGRHTLMIELLAKNYRQNIQLKSIADFAGKIAERKIDDQVLQRLVRVAHSEREVRMYEYLLRVFDLGKLDDKALHLLKQIAVLPAEPLPIDLILMTKENEQDVYSEALEGLEQKGWVSFKGEEYVQMHRLVQMLILKITLPTYQDCKMLCNIITNALDLDNSPFSVLQKQWASGYADVLLKNILFQYSLEQKLVLINNLSCFYNKIGNYSKGIQLLEGNKLLFENLCGKNSEQYTAYLNNIADFYCDVNLYDKAILLYQEALQIIEKISNKKNIGYIVLIINLGKAYRYKKEYEKSIKLLQEVLEIIKEENKKENIYYLSCLSNLAILYENIENYENSFYLHQEIIQICEKMIKNKYHYYATVLDYYATSLNNLATWYIRRRDYENSLFFYQKSLQIKLSILGEKNPDFAMTLYSIGENLIKLQQKEEGVRHIIEAYQILVKEVGNEHPYTQQVYKASAYYLEMRKKGEL